MDSISHAMTERSKALTENVNNEEYGPEHSAYSKQILKVPNNIDESLDKEPSGQSK